MRRRLRGFPALIARCLAASAEKLAFVASLVLVAILAAAAVMREGLPWTAEDLRGLVQEARQNLQATEPSLPETARYHELTKQSRKRVDPQDFSLAVPFHRPFRKEHKRASPPVYAVEQLRASADHGMFAMGGPDGSASAGGGPLQGQRWVAVTGTIEHLRQVEAFGEALQPGYRDSARDYPRYVYFRIERMEVDPRRPEAEGQWIRLNVRQMEAVQRYWRGPAPEIVDERCLPPATGGLAIAFPLGPRQDRPWGPEVGHPRIPIKCDPQEAGEPECLLLRFFDYDVEPGRSYRYRARLLLANPNYGLPARCLEQEESAGIRFLESRWSEPSPVATVPRDTGVLVVAGDQRKQKATLMLTRLQLETGQFTAEECEAVRGQLLNFHDRPYRPCGPSSLAALTTHAASARTPKAEGRKTDYVTETLVLDIRGGGRLRGRDRLIEPATVLLLDAEGNFVVHSELDDLAERRFYEPARNAPEPQTPMARWTMPDVRQVRLSNLTDR